MRAAPALLALVASFAAPGCPDGRPGAGPDAGAPGSDAGRPTCNEDDVGLDDTDVGTHCAGAFVDVFVFPPQPGMNLELEEGAALPGTLALRRDDDGWHLTGLAPPTSTFIDASFVLRASWLHVGTDGECLARTTFGVGLIIDPCDGGDGTCGPFADAYPIAGFCLPERIDPNVAFGVETLVSACIGSTCHEVRPARCDVSVVAGALNEVAVGGDACVRARDIDACSEDCGGGDGATCAVPPLPAGEARLTSSAGELVVTIPYTRPANGIDCVYPDG